MSLDAEARPSTEAKRHALKLLLAGEDLKRICVAPFDVNGDGSVMVRCNSRSRSRCPSCSQFYVGDWAAIARSGIFDEDGHPFTGYTWALVTLTAPSFGPVHSAPHRLRDTSTRCKCGALHDYGDPIAGQPIRPDDYNYRDTLAFNQYMPRLFSRTVDRWRRTWGRDLAYFAVTEAQRRGTMHKHIIVRFPTGLFDPVDLLDLASSSYTAAWSGDVIRWGSQMDIQVLDAHHTPEEAASSTQYVVKAVSYTLKDVDHERGDVTPATRALMSYARFDYRCTADCEGVTCTEPIHDDLAESERVLSQSKGWSLTKLTRTRLRRERRAFMETLSASTGTPDPQATARGISQAEQWRARQVRRYRIEIERRQRAESRRQWEECQEPPEPFPDRAEEPIAKLDLPIPDPK